MSGVALVTGATGVIGPRVVDALSAAGLRVRIYARRIPNALPWTAPAECVEGSLEDEAALSRAVRGVECIVHLAARLHDDTHTRAAQDACWATNVDGTRRVAQAARQQNARLVLASTVAVYGPNPGRVVDEATPPRPDTTYGESKVEAERIVLGLRGLDGRPLGTVMRLGAVYGPRMKGNYIKLIQSEKRGLFVCVGDGSNRRSLIYETDAAAAMALAAASVNSRGAVFNVTDGSIYSVREILASISSALGRSSRQWHVPVAPVRVAAACGDAVRRVTGWPVPLTTEILTKWLEDLAVESGAIRHHLGFRSAVTLEAGWAQTVLALRIAQRI